jgi:hypothetical protein
MHGPPFPLAREHVRAEESDRGLIEVPAAYLRGRATSAARSHRGSSRQGGRSSRPRCAQADNACDFRRANAWHYTAPKVTPALKAVRAMQGSSSTERPVRVGIARNCTAEA